MLDELRLEVTKPCNLACVHCYTNKLKPVSLTLERARAIITEAAALGATALSLTGGEPLLSLERTVQLSEAGAENGLQVRLNTNATKLTRSVAALLFASGIHECQISMHSADPTRFDEFVRRQGAFEAVTRGIKAAITERLRVSVRFTLTQYNHAELTPTYRLSKLLGASSFKLRTVVEAAGVVDRPVRTGEASARASLANFYEAISHECDMHISISDNSFGIPLPQSPSITSLQCKCGARAVFVAADGNVYPCVFLRESEDHCAGDATSTSLSQILHESSVLKRFIGSRADNSPSGNDVTAGCKAACLCAAATSGEQDDGIPGFQRHGT